MNTPIRILVACLGLSVAAPTTLRAADLDWYAEPYLWATSINADLDVNVPPALQTQASFTDIVDKIDGGFLGHIEGQGDTFGAFADVIYLGLGDNKDFPRASTDSDLDSVIFELAAVYSPGADRFNGFDVFAGLRYLDVDMKTRIDPVNPEVPSHTIDAGGSFSDFLLGARYTTKFSDRWGMTLRGDGSWGDTEGTWNASITFHYQVSAGAWVFGWRHMEVELQPNVHTLDLTMDGLLAGFAFKF